MKENTKKHFEKLHDYDQQTDYYYMQRRFEELKNVLKKHDKNIRILDIGCATGEFISKVNELGYGNTHGLDISKTLVQIARDKGIDNSLVSSGEILPFKDNEFDLIILADVIEHLPNYRNCLLETGRVLKRGGIAFVVYPNPNVVPLLNLFASIGLKLDTRENKIPLDDLKKCIEGVLCIEEYKTIILGSKLPMFLLKLLERIEMELPAGLLNTIGFARVLILRKR